MHFGGSAWVRKPKSPEFRLFLPGVYRYSKASLDVIRRTSHELITEIDRNRDTIAREQINAIKKEFEDHSKGDSVTEERISDDLQR